MGLVNMFALVDGLSAYAAASAFSLAPRTTLTVGIVLLAQAALILALVRLAHRRRHVQRQLEARLQFETGLLRLTLTLSAAAPERIGDVLQTEILPLASQLGVDRVWCWTFLSDPYWDAQLLREGQTAWFTNVSALPPTLRAGYGASQPARQISAVAVPITREGKAYGGVFCASSAAPGPSASRDELHMIATTIANLLQQKRAERALEHGDRLKGDILASLPAHVAVLDRDGTIIAVNDAWTTFATANGKGPERATGRGANYLAVCAEGVRAGCAGAAEALVLIESACRGESSGATVEYPSGLPGNERWFVMTAHPLRRPEGGAVVTHFDITQRRLHEVALRESEGRFRRMADALPVAVWMSEVDGSCSYLNEQWIALTGREPAEQMGSGWLESVHPDDQAACLEAYMRAFAARQRFSVEYRLCRADGEYRWVLDVGMPRYGPDGTFHGYVGGCIDITERREAERQIRDVNQRLILAQEDERRHIARELHDHLSQQLALLAFDLQQLTLARPSSVDAIADTLDTALRRTAEIASDVHAMSHRLHPSKLAALGLVATIRAHCRDMSRQNLAVSFVDRHVPAALPPDADVCLFRVLEEGLTNVVRHSRASVVNVSLRGQNGHLVLRIVDNGSGFDQHRDAATGIGLVSMQERLKALGGKLVISSVPGRGTAVEARLPCSLTPADRPVSLADRKAGRQRGRHAESA